MFPNHRLRKSLIVIGGSGEFGQRITTRFAKPLLKRWNVFNIDAVPNPHATENFIIDGLHEFKEDGDFESKSNNNKAVFNGEMLKKLHSQLAQMAPEFDAIVNLAAAPRSMQL